MSKYFPTLFAHLFPPRFSGKFYVDGDSGCWVWTAGKSSTGYGHLRIDGQDLKAHRYSYAYANNRVERELGVIRHKCDNRVCVNPDHLEEGSHQDNTDDLYSRQGSRKLTLDKVKEIKERLDQGSKQKELAQEYNVHPSVISHINTGRSWSKYL